MAHHEAQLLLHVLRSRVRHLAIFQQAPDIKVLSAHNRSCRRSAPCGALLVHLGNHLRGQWAEQAFKHCKLILRGLGVLNTQQSAVLQQLAVSSAAAVTGNRSQPSSSSQMMDPKLHKSAPNCHPATSITCEHTTQPSHHCN